MDAGVAVRVKREGVDLEGKRLIIVRKTGDDDADMRLARAIANGTGRFVCLLDRGQEITVLSDDDLARMGLQRITP